MEFLTDSVQLSLHDGVPQYDDNTKGFVLEFGRTMTQALTDQVRAWPLATASFSRPASPR
jgi:hypothetical protein